MMSRSQVYKTSEKMLRLAKADGEPVMFVVNSTRREGWIYQGYYVWESGGSTLITDHVERIVDPRIIE